MTIHEALQAGQPHHGARRHALQVSLAAIALVVSACGADDSPPDEDPGRAEGPLYAVSHSIYTDDGATSYLTLVDSLAAGPAVDLSTSLEFGGGARAYGPEGSDAVYVTSSEAGTMTEVSFEPDGSPQVGRAVSFANLGIDGTTGGNVHLFISPTKAYFASQATGEIVVWDPRAMEITTTISLGLNEVLPQGGFFYFYPRPIVADGRLVLVANVGDAEDFDMSVAVSVVDTNADRLLSTTADDRCHGFLQSAVDAQGDRYFASSDYSAAQHFLLPERAPAPCMLRIRAGETGFDPEWSRSLTEDLETRLWTGVTPGPDGAMYVQDIAEDDPGVTSAAEGQEAFEVTTAAPWSWRLLGEGDGAPATPIDVDFLESPPTFAAIPVDGDAYVAVGGEVETTLVNVTSSQTPKASLVVPGYVFNIVRIR